MLNEYKAWERGGVGEKAGVRILLRLSRALLFNTMDGKIHVLYRLDSWAWSESGSLQHKVWAPWGKWVPSLSVCPSLYICTAWLFPLGPTPSRHD